MKRKLLIIGAGGHGRVATDIAIKMKNWDKIAFLDDNEESKNFLGINVIGTSKNIESYLQDWDLFVAIGNNQKREQLCNSIIEKGATLPLLIHPSAIIGSGVDLGVGTIIMAGVVVNSSSKIGKGCIINTCSSIDHDNEIYDYSHVSPGTHIAGNVSVGERCWIGIGSILINNLRICSDTIIGAGSLVLRNIDEPGTYVGVPVKKIG